MMGRQSRLVADGLVYHTRNRGHNRPAVWSAAADRAAVLEALGQTEERYPYLMKSWCQIIFLVVGADVLPEHRRMAPFASRALAGPVESTQRG